LASLLLQVFIGAFTLMTGPFAPTDVQTAGVALWMFCYHCSAIFLSRVGNDTEHVGGVGFDVAADGGHDLAWEDRNVEVNLLEATNELNNARGQVLDGTHHLGRGGPDVEAGVLATLRGLHQTNLHFPGHAFVAMDLEESELVRNDGGVVCAGLSDKFSVEKNGEVVRGENVRAGHHGGHPEGNQDGGEGLGVLDLGGNMASGAQMIEETARGSIRGVNWAKKAP